MTEIHLVEHSTAIVNLYYRHGHCHCNYVKLRHAWASRTGASQLELLSQVFGSQQLTKTSLRSVFIPWAQLR